MTFPMFYIQFIFKKFRFVRGKSEIQWINIINLRKNTNNPIDKHLLRKKLDWIEMFVNTIDREEDNLRSSLEDYPFEDRYDLDVNSFFTTIDVLDGRWKRFVQELGMFMNFY